MAEKKGYFSIKKSSMLPFMVSTHDLRCGDKFEDSRLHALQRFFLSFERFVDRQNDSISFALQEVFF